MSTARLAVRVAPGGRGDAILEAAPDRVRLRVAAPPEKGRANQAVVALLARSLGVPGAAVTIVRGAASRQKTVLVEGLTTEEALARLKARVRRG